MGTEASISQHELKLAHYIQHSFLPQQLVQVPGAEIAALVAVLAGQPADKVIDGVAKAVVGHAANVPQSDDLTLVGLRVVA